MLKPQVFDGEAQVFMVSHSPNNGALGTASIEVARQDSDSRNCDRSATSKGFEGPEGRTVGLENK